MAGGAAPTPAPAPTRKRTRKLTKPADAGAAASSVEPLEEDDDDSVDLLGKAKANGSFKSPRPTAALVVSPAMSPAADADDGEAPVLSDDEDEDEDDKDGEFDFYSLAKDRWEESDQEDDESEDEAYDPTECPPTAAAIWLGKSQKRSTKRARASDGAEEAVKRGPQKPKQAAKVAKAAAGEQGKTADSSADSKKKKQDEDDRQKAEQAQKEAASKAKSSCPRGWEIHFSKSKFPGRPYWFRIIDGHQQWEEPPTVVIAAQESAAAAASTAKPWPPWYCDVDGAKRETYDAEVSQKLEASFQGTKGDVKFSRKNHRPGHRRTEWTYTVDVAAMTQRNDTTGVKRAIHRVQPIEAKTAMAADQRPSLSAFFKKSPGGGAKAATTGVEAAKQEAPAFCAKRKREVAPDGEKQPKLKLKALQEEAEAAAAAPVLSDDEDEDEDDKDGDEDEGESQFDSASLAKKKQKISKSARKKKDAVATELKKLRLDGNKAALEQNLRAPLEELVECLRKEEATKKAALEQQLAEEKRTADERQKTKAAEATLKAKKRKRRKEEMKKKKHQEEQQKADQDKAAKAAEADLKQQLTAEKKKTEDARQAADLAQKEAADNAEAAKEAGAKYKILNEAAEDLRQSQQNLTKQVAEEKRKADDERQKADLAQNEAAWTTHPSLDIPGVSMYICKSSTTNCRETTEYNIAAAQFAKISDIQIKRVRQVDVYVNDAAKSRYEDMKTALGSRGAPTKEVWTFHGTRHAKDIKSIMKDGFKIGGQDGHPVAVGSACGQGCYTAIGPGDRTKDSPMHYAAGSRRVILARAVPGNRLEGKSCDGGPPSLAGVDSWTPSSRKDWLILKTKEQILPYYVVHYA